MICQQIELLEVFTSFEGANRYVVKTPQGQQLFFAAEESGCCERQIFGPARPFELKILSNTNQIVTNAIRPLRCGPPLFCCPGLIQSMEVHGPTGVPLGRVQQNWNIVPSYTCYDAAEVKICDIKGPLCYFTFCDVEFTLEGEGGQPIGSISKKFSGLQEFFTDADNFGVQFPIGMSVEHKAVILNAVFLIDFNYFEESPDHS